jgi:hypothetical protein
MLTQIIDIDTRQYANTEQSGVFAQATTDFFVMQDVMFDRATMLITQVSRGRHLLPRPEVLQSLERSLVEHGEIWAELAKQ